MVVEDDLSYMVRPHLVFKATSFVWGEGQSTRDADGTLERDLQDKRVDISFQENAWVDAKTNLYGLSKAKTVFERIGQALQFDNLSSHKTPAVNEFRVQLSTRACCIHWI